MQRKRIKKIILLKSTSSYPAPYKDLNLISIKYMKRKFNCDIGFSDHSLGIVPAITSVALGFNVIEKHFKINEKGLNSKFQLIKPNLKNLVEGCNIAKLSFGKIFRSF